MPLDEIVDAREDKTSEEEFLEEARERFQEAADYEAENRKAARDDLAMLKGNQWPADVANQRDADNRPILTVNRLPAFTEQVIADARVNRMSIKVRPTKLHEPLETSDAEEIAETYNGLIRAIENISDAPMVYQTGLEGAVNQGFGYIEVVTEYTDDDVFELDARIKAIRNAFTVYYDPKCESPDGRDSRYVFKSRLISKGEFKVLYPDVEPTNWKDADAGQKHWFDGDQVRIAEYKVKRTIKKTIVKLEDGMVLEKKQYQEFKEASEKLEKEVPKVVRERTVDSPVVAEYIIDGAQIIDGPKYKNGKWVLNFRDEDDVYNEDGSYRDGVWPGRYIPIVPVWGKELIIDDERVLSGLIRHAKDAQRMFNYQLTAEIERVALAKKPPVRLTPTQIEGYTDMWGSRANLPYQLYNPDPQAPPPIDPDTPQASSANIHLANIGIDAIKATTGLFDPSLGARSNETSGRAIRERKQEGDMATFRFHDNLRRAVKYVGDILVDLLPKILDTERQMMILDEQGKEGFVTVNESVQMNGQTFIKRNLSKGKYAVTVTAGPSFGTQRLEASEALSSLAGSLRDPISSMVLVSQAIANQDWPGAQRAARAIERRVPPYLFAPEGAEPPQQGPSAEQVMNAAKLRTETAKAAQLESEIEMNKQALQDSEGEKRKMMEDAAQGAMEGTLKQLAPYLQMLGGGGQNV